jgi:hypothetical protein
MYRGQRGQVLPLVAVCLAILMGFAAMAIDVGFLEYRQRQQQNATDAAAIGGAQQFVYSGCGANSAATSAAQNDAATNGYTNGGNGVSVAVTTPPSGGPYAGNTCAVQVQINNPQTQTFFSRLFGWTSMQETTQAVAAALANNNSCAYLLSSTATPDFHGAKISAAGCGLMINGSPTFDGGNIDFSSIGYAGSVTEHGTKWGGAAPTQMLPVADPCPEIAGCNYLTNNPPSTSNCTALTASGTINPGCYSSISGSVSAMNPGLYVFTGPISLSGGTVTGSGVTIYVADGGSIDLHGITGDFSACTTSCTGGAVSNVLYYQPPSNANAMTFAGPQSSYSGLIYAPSADVTYDGNAGTGYTVMVFGSWTLNGTGQGMSFTPPTQGQSLLYEAVLVQ